MFPDRVFYSERDLDALGLPCRTTRWRMRREGKFPEPIQISQGRKAYPAKAIADWIEERMEVDHAA